MGMDVFGKRPKSEAGKYFRASVWTWRPLAELVTELAPVLTDGCEHWQTNDGDGLPDPEAELLGELLEGAIADGTVKRWLEMRDLELSKLPPTKCECCGGTGIRTDEVGQPDRLIPADERHYDGNPHPRRGQTGWCNGCNGIGHYAHWRKSYAVDIEMVAEFATFLKASGGFEIH